MLKTRRLILTFDAFGTLFIPREPIAKSYADAGRRHGLSGFTDDEIALSFRDAFKRQSKSAPNYGKKVDMDAIQWWSDVVRSTFRPFNSSSALPSSLIPDLLNRFSSSEGYMLCPDVMSVFQDLRKMKQSARKKATGIEIHVGIITNSDDRVPSILSSLGLAIGSPRHGMQLSTRTSNSMSPDLADIDFVILSYDVGFEKPCREIFDAAKDLGRYGKTQVDREKYIHVGDDIDKDIEGAVQAGWEGILLDRAGDCVQRKPILAGASIPDLSGLIPRIQQEWTSRVSRKEAIEG